ncbi:hypothetical protein [Hymenobacter sp. UYP22]|uniref:hypothetical protein n=1 Tax=Hymenobacter sp. UYP22 TaxID=3156348 RepID=UPI003396C39A
MLFTDPIPGFVPNAGAPIAPAEAEQWAANYRNQPQTQDELAGRKRTKAYYFGNQLLDTIQQQPGCVGIRFYMGLEQDLTGDKSKDEYQLLAVGVDVNGYDLVPRTSPAGELLNEDGIVGDGSLKCPSVCDPTSPMSN